MEYYEYFNDQVEKIVSSSAADNLVLYSFGRQGMLVKDTLITKGS